MRTLYYALAATCMIVVAAGMAKAKPDGAEHGISQSAMPTIVAVGPQQPAH